METTGSGDVIEDDKKVLVNDAEMHELQKLLASVVYKRKTVPAKCMKMYKEIIQYDIKRLERTDIKLKDSENELKFMKLVHKLSLCKPPKLSFEDLHKAEKRLLSLEEKLKNINAYFKKRKQCNQ